jgi:hypothetical protein
MIIGNVMAVDYNMASGTQSLSCPIATSYFYDNGGSAGNYTASASLTETFSVTTSGYGLQFTFTSFQTQNGNDILTIYDGPNTSSPVIGQFSGTASPGTVVSSTSSLTFSFVSNSVNSLSGWAATMSCVALGATYKINDGSTPTSTCGGLFYDSGGAGSNYSGGEDYTRTFTSNSSGNCLKVTFYSFSLGSNDYLRVYDGTSTAAPQIGTYDASIPQTLLSSSGSLTFRFTSNNGGSVSSGWMAVIDCETCPSSPAATATYTMYTSGQQNTYLGGNMVNTCSGTLSDDGGLSGNYSASINNIYRNFCPSTEGMCLRVQFHSIYLINSFPSIYDYLEVGYTPTQNAGNNYDVYITGVNCTSYDACMGLGIGPYTSYDQSGCLRFRFGSDGSSQASGFSATLDCVPCSNGPSAATNSDCQHFTNVCTDVSFSDASTGPGIVSDGGQGCVLAENYSNWYKITIAQSGTLGLNITPVTSTDDYDFALYGPNATCSSLGTPTRCSYAANTGNTGMGNGASDQSEDVTGDAWVSTLTVTAGETYYLMVNKWSAGGNGFTLDWNLSNGASLDCTPLPVTLSSFTCKPEGDAITLDWKTESEFNNNHFIVEKSADGENFEILTLVPGKGTTAYPSEYFVADFKPFPGVNYYRLSQIDNGGSKKQLQTTVCETSLQNEEVLLRLFDVSGRELLGRKILASELDQVLQQSDLPAGVYLTAIVHRNGKYEVGKFLKQ